MRRATPCVWAKEGLFEGLDVCAGDMEAVNSQVISACTEDGRLYMAPLTATQRQIAVNRRLLERQHFDYLTSATEHPVWYPMEFDQLLEDFALAKTPAVEIWEPRPEDCAALEALIQAIYGGTMLTEDGRHSQIEHVNVRAGLEWLRDRVRNGMIAQAESRQDALEHFLSGKTALFIRLDASGRTAQCPSAQGERHRAGDRALSDRDRAYDTLV